MAEVEGKAGGDRQIYTLTINHPRLSRGTTGSLHRGSALTSDASCHDESRGLPLSQLDSFTVGVNDDDVKINSGPCAVGITFASVCYLRLKRPLKLRKGKWFSAGLRGKNQMGPISQEVC